MTLNNEPKQELGYNIKKRRLELGLTQELLAEQLQVTQAFISQIERGEKTPNIYIIKQLAKILQYDINNFFK